MYIGMRLQHHAWPHSPPFVLPSVDAVSRHRSTAWADDGHCVCWLARPWGDARPDRLWQLASAQKLASKHLRHHRSELTVLSSMLVSKVAHNTWKCKTESSKTQFMYTCTLRSCTIACTKQILCCALPSFKWAWACWMHFAFSRCFRACAVDHTRQTFTTYRNNTTYTV